MAALLLECLSEEIPAGVQPVAGDDLAKHLCAALERNHIDFAKDSVMSFTTPRRLAVLVGEAAAEAAARRQEIKGPKQAAGDQALSGFLRKYGLPDASACEVRDVGGHATYFYVSEQAGGRTVDLLPTLIGEVLHAQNWQKSMRFGHQQLAWVRPLRNILVMFGKEIIFGSLDLGGGDILEFSDHSYGLRRLPPETINIASAESYDTVLAEHAIIADAEKRRNTIATAIEKLTAEHDLQWHKDAALLTEVSGLVESPQQALGRIDSQFMALPDEVLSEAMVVHQKYFPLFDRDGKLAPYFSFTANLPISDTIIAGNERVLRARLQDAAFMLEEDKKISLAKRLPHLKNMNYFHGLGSMHDKTERLQKLAAYCAPIFAVDKNSAKRTAKLLKADLLTEMVGEFPALQGIMGAEYAKMEGYDEAIVHAIGNQYKLIDSAAPLSHMMALIDKIDHLAGFWLIGKEPSGSKDPFALRRAAIGVLHIIETARIDTDLETLFHKALKAYNKDYDRQCAAALVQFCCDRYKILLREQGFAYDVLDAVFAAPEAARHILQIPEKLKALSQFLTKQTEAENAIAALKRIANILKNETQFSEVKENLLTEQAEKELHRHYKETFADKQISYAERLQKISRLRPQIDNFFDNVMVNHHNEKTRQNRLNLLKTILREAEILADFQRIVQNENS